MPSYKKMSLLVLLLTATGCSQFASQRSYLTAMENDDSSFFHPREDFQVVSGDTGRDWESAEERQNRTPTSEGDEQADRARRLLKQELRQLESAQSDTGLEFYEKYKRYLATTSERIYFLKLSSYERKEYLATRGFIAERSPASYNQLPTAHTGSLSPGMTKEDIATTWGRPNRVEVAGNPSFENERWLYTVNGATKYIYFESGRVQGWE